MKATLKKASLLCVLLAAAAPLHAQKIQLGEVLIMSTPTLGSEADAKAYEALITGRVAPAWKDRVPGVALHLLRADRGARKNEYLLVWAVDRQARRNASLPKDNSSPFPEKTLAKLSSLSKSDSAYLGKVKSFTDYVLVGADKAGPLPAVDLLGIHSIKVKPDKKEAFERFIRDKLHPAVAHILPDMRLLYYKGIRGENAGSYILIFAIESFQARERYWPTSASETQILKDAFRPLKPLALELSSYLVDGSYLNGSSNAAAAYFEGRQWTDFMTVGRKPQKIGVRLQGSGSGRDRAR